MRWTVVVTEVAERELSDLPEDVQAHFVRVSELLEEFGPQGVAMPHVRPLRGKLWEMRMRGRDGIARAIYFAHTGRKLVVVRVFQKKTQTTPVREIALALRRMTEMDR